MAPCMPITPSIPSLTAQRFCPVRHWPAPGRRPPVLAPTRNRPPLAIPCAKDRPSPKLRSTAAAPIKNAGDRCKVGFWNLTGHAVSLKIDGQTRQLPRDQAVTLDLARAFVYQVDQGTVITERVPAGESFHEVILRQ